MMSEKEEKVYASVLRMVLWGEPDEDVFRKLEVNGYTGDAARQIYEAARRERIAHIRGPALRRLATGLASVLGGAMILFYMTSGERRMTKGGFVAIAIAFTFGLWKLVDGVGDFVLAGRKEGSVVEEEWE